MEFKQEKVERNLQRYNVAERKRAHFHCGSFYLDFTLIRFNDGATEFPWSLYIHENFDDFPLAGISYKFLTEKEAITKAELIWKNRKEELIAYLNEN